MSYVWVIPPIYVVAAINVLYGKRDWPALTRDMLIISRHGMGRGPPAPHIRASDE